MIPSLSPLGWLKLAAGGLLALGVISAGLSIKGWFDNNARKHAESAQEILRLEDIEQTLRADVARLNNEVRKAAEDLDAAKKIFDANTAKLARDLQLVVAARDRAVTRAKEFDKLRNEIFNAPDDRLASSSLVHAVTGVRGLLRGRIEDPATSPDRMADPDRARRPADRAEPVPGLWRTGAGASAGADGQ